MKSYSIILFCILLFSLKIPVFKYRSLFWISAVDGICKNGCERSGANSEKHEFSCCLWSTKLQDNLVILNISLSRNLHKWPLEPEREIFSVLS